MTDMKTMRITIFLFIFLPKICFAESLSFNGNSKTPQNKPADLVMACSKTPDRDDTCKQILLLNDFAQRFVEQILLYSAIRDYQRYITPFASVMITRKVTVPISGRPHRIDATYNLDSKEYSINFMKSF